MANEAIKLNDSLMKIESKLCRIEEVLIGSKEVLTFDEASVYSGISKSYLYKLTSTGGIPCYKPSGKLLYFHKPELDAWMLSNRKATNEEMSIKANTLLMKKGGGR